MTTWEERAEALWQLLDDIDTADDACRGNDQAFRERTRTLIQRRFAILSSDGYKLSIPEAQGAPAASANRSSDHDCGCDDPEIR